MVSSRVMGCFSLLPEQFKERFRGPPGGLPQIRRRVHQVQFARACKHPLKITLTSIKLDRFGQAWYT